MKVALHPLADHLRDAASICRSQQTRSFLRRQKDARDIAASSTRETRVCRGKNKRNVSAAFGMPPRTPKTPHQATKTRSFSSEMRAPRSLVCDGRACNPAFRICFWALRFAATHATTKRASRCFAPLAAPTGSICHEHPTGLVVNWKNRKNHQKDKSVLASATSCLFFLQEGEGLDPDYCRFY